MSWKQIEGIDVFGTSLFQNLCCREVARFIPEVKFEEQGADEKHFVAEIPQNEIKVYVYQDSAEIVSPSLNVRFERADSATPEDLTMQLIKALSNAF